MLLQLRLRVPPVHKWTNDTVVAFRVVFVYRLRFFLLFWDVALLVYVEVVAALGLTDATPLHALRVHVEVRNLERRQVPNQRQHVRLHVLLLLSIRSARHIV